ncbi:hypothetical protein CTAYLR_007069 [Chrysophaeum taylorii]|uniref:Uncharacterized protein n=1 Tax=Chrysophaeum taylorii TaxID=2483200 RepID=A0AAD7UM49_9STRA|nr:hypothetical protein CTAYLR_007069 [Chrysophaeum taylorii]
MAGTTTPIKRKAQIKACSEIGYLYPQRASLLDRRVLVEDLRRLERKLCRASTRAVALERETLETAVLRKKNQFERRVTLRLETSVRSMYVRLLRALEEEDDDDDPEETLRAMLCEEDIKVRQGLQPGLARSKSTPALHAVADDEVASAARSAALARAGEQIVARVEAAFLVRRDKSPATAEKEEDPRVRELEETANAFAKKAAAAEARAAELQTELEERTTATLNEQRAAIDARLEKREFRNAVLEVLGQLSTAVHRRLGFVPSETRRDINEFIKFLADTEEEEEEEEEEERPQLEDDDA